jgi:Arc/MetJ-type ribon-helix-helix transcriptional regulator
MKKHELFVKSIHVKLTDEQYNYIESFRREKGLESNSELIRQAVIAYIGRDTSDATFKLQAAAKTQDKVDEVRDMVDVLFRYLRLMHINLLGYHPAIDEEYSEITFNSATERHNRFFEAVQDSLRSDPAFFERLLHNYFSGSIK